MDLRHFNDLPVYNVSGARIFDIREKNMRIKSFFKLLFTFVLIFALIANTVFTVLICSGGGSFFGYEFSSSTEQSYINALLLGVDKEGYRTDVIIFAQLNLVDGELNMLQIPRDTYVNNGRSDHKINSAYGYNKEEQVFKEVKKVIGVDIDKYILIDTAGFRDLIDTIGGVDFEVPINMNYDDPVQDFHIHLNAGMQHLDGDKAEQFVRFRMNNDGTGYAMGDIERMQAQSKFIQATIDEVFKLVNVFKLNDLVRDFSKIVKSNFTLNEMLSYAPYVFATDREKMVTYQLQGEARYIGRVSYFVADDNANEKLIDEHFTPSSETVSRTELEIQQNVIGVASETVRIGAAKPSKSVINRFASVDILDASNGEADADALKSELEKYGFNVKKIYRLDGTVYDGTVVVSKRKNPRAASAAAIAGQEEYILNSEKVNGSDITIIVGRDTQD